MKMNIVLLGILIGIIVLPSCNNKNSEKTVELILSVQSERSDSYKIYYDIGNGFNETDIAVAAYTYTNQIEKLSFKLKNVTNGIIKSIRIDPGTSAGLVFINEARLLNLSEPYIWSAEEVYTLFKPAFQITSYTYQTNKDSVQILSSGTDPSIAYMNANLK